MVPWMPPWHCTPLRVPWPGRSSSSVLEYHGGVWNLVWQSSADRKVRMDIQQRLKNRKDYPYRYPGRVLKGSIIRTTLDSQEWSKEWMLLAGDCHNVIMWLNGFCHQLILRSRTADPMRRSCKLQKPSVKGIERHPTRCVFMKTCKKKHMPRCWPFRIVAPGHRWPAQRVQ